MFNQWNYDLQTCFSNLATFPVKGSDTALCVDGAAAPVDMGWVF